TPSADYQRRHVYYEGYVQGVGFRYTAARIARRCDVTGFVRNLPDGKVELVVEGAAGELDRVTGEVLETMAEYIQNAREETSPATGEFSEFVISY
ncbi:MAG: acylphosphatase, partial [Thermoguttaceae bacterium]